MDILQIMKLEIDICILTLIAYIYWVQAAFGELHSTGCTSYTLIDNWKRSTAYALQATDVPISDYYMIIAGNWYRFQAYGNDVRMPELEAGEVVPARSCGTQSPIWIKGNDTHPKDSENATIVSVCLSYGISYCDWTTSITIALCRCGGCDDYFVYQLVSPLSTGMAYCAGDKIYCKPGEIYDPGLGSCVVFTSKEVSPTTLSAPHTPTVFTDRVTPNSTSTSTKPETTVQETISSSSTFAPLPTTQQPTTQSHYSPTVSFSTHGQSSTHADKGVSTTESFGGTEPSVGSLYGTTGAPQVKTSIVGVIVGASFVVIVVLIVAGGITWRNRRNKNNSTRKDAEDQNEYEELGKIEDRNPLATVQLGSEEPDSTGQYDSKFKGVYDEIPTTTYQENLPAGIDVDMVEGRDALTANIETANYCEIPISLKWMNEQES